MSKIYLSANLYIDDQDFSFDFVRASGPGGQHVNKVSTAVKLKYNISNIRGLSDELRERLLGQIGHRLSGDGWIVIEAKSSRSQLKNKNDAVTRLVMLLREACILPKERKSTKPSRNAVKRRLKQKKHKSELKKSRRTPSGFDD